MREYFSTGPTYFSPFLHTYTYMLAAGSYVYTLYTLLSYSVLRAYRSSVYILYVYVYIVYVFSYSVYIVYMLLL